MYWFILILNNYHMINMGIGKYIVDKWSAYVSINLSLLQCVNMSDWVDMADKNVSWCALLYYVRKW